jgi:signal transduction histidine kinase
LLNSCRPSLALRLRHLVERQLVRLAPRPCQLAGEVREALLSFAPIASARHIRVEQSLDDAACATVDVEAFRQIVLNLVDNAIKYSPTSGTVWVSLGVRGDVVRLDVEDEGLGIPPGDAERVWTPFFRLERDVKSAVAGSGIGLAVVRDLVQRHGGRTGVEPRPGREQRGSRFFVELPRSAALAPERAERPTENAVPDFETVGAREGDA